MGSMKSSRKGTRLNDVRYFRLPLPHVRRRMRMIRVMTGIADSRKEHFCTVQNSRPNPVLELNTKIPNRGRLVESKQSSIEITLMTYDGNCLDVDRNDKNGRRDVYVETEIIESTEASESVLQEDVPEIVRDDLERTMKEVPRTEDDHRAIAQEIVHHEQLRSQIEHNHKSVDRKANYGDRVIEKEAKCSNRWKDGGQVILHFFARILGKSARMAAERATGRTILTNGQHGKRMKRVSRISKNRNGHTKGIDREICLKRVSNGYTANRYLYRDESRHGVTEDKSQEEHPSILVRQIQRTRDKNLRVMLLEQELRARLLRTDSRLTSNGVFNARQLSSPLC